MATAKNTKTAKKTTAATAEETTAESSSATTDRVETAVRFARDAAHTYVGVGLVLQDRVSQRKFELVDYRSFLDEAKAKGEAQVSEIQSKIDPIAAKFTQTVEPIADFIESNVPSQVKQVIDSNRDRVRDLLAR